MNQALTALRHHVSGAIERCDKEAITEQPVRLATTIPFDGFYNSCHDQEIDRAEEMMLEDNNGDAIPGLAERFYADNSISYSRLHEVYWNDYLQAYAIHARINLIPYQLSSPKEYNFTTDRIFAEISLADAERLFASVDRTRLDELIRERFTSRSGFISFYENSLDKWPKSVKEWDHNQVGTLLEVAIPEFDQQEYADDLNSDGELSNWLDDALTEAGQRISRIAQYLRERQERSYC